MAVWPPVCGREDSALARRRLASGELHVPQSMKTPLWWRNEAPRRTSCLLPSAHDGSPQASGRVKVHIAGRHPLRQAEGGLRTAGILHRSAHVPFYGAGLNAGRRALLVEPGFARHLLRAYAETEITVPMLRTVAIRLARACRLEPLDGLALAAEAAAPALESGQAVFGGLTRLANRGGAGAGRRRFTNGGIHGRFQCIHLVRSGSIVPCSLSILGRIRHVGG